MQFAKLAAFGAMSFAGLTACDGDTTRPDPTGLSGGLEYIQPGPACLVPNTSTLDFGENLVGSKTTLAVTLASCDGAAVEVGRVSVIDGFDMLTQARVVRPDGSVITPRMPHLLAPDEDLVVLVTFRASASARDLLVERTLRIEADSREVPEVPGRLDISLAGQPRTSCPDDACGGPAQPFSMVSSVRGGGGHDYNVLEDEFGTPFMADELWPDCRTPGVPCF